MPPIPLLEPLWLTVLAAAALAVQATRGLFARRPRIWPCGPLAARFSATDPPQGDTEPEQSPSSRPEPPLLMGTLQRESSFWADLLRGIVILVAVAVLLALLLILFPQSTFDRMVGYFESRHSSGVPPEKIALLYLGDEVKGSEFHIRGVVRNITTTPVEKLDATVRLYAADGTLLETALVRMDADVIEPDAFALFHLTYPNYSGQLGSYSVDFKLRQGDLVPYKDMRGARAQQ